MKEINIDKGYFITGTDTEIGKTHVSVELIKELANQGLRVSGLKPIASGCEQTANGLRNSDALQLQAAANVDLEYKHINRYSFEPAVAPHIIAKQLGQEIDLSLIKKDVETALAISDLTVVEGAGGWMVPLNKEETVADLAQLLDLPVILVVGIRLGCINHALMSLAEISHAEVPIKGWVANFCTANTELAQEQVFAIKNRTEYPLLAEIKFDPFHKSHNKWELTY